MKKTNQEIITEALDDAFVSGGKPEVVELLQWVGDYADALWEAMGEAEAENEDEDEEENE